MKFLSKYPFYFWLLPLYFLLHNYNLLFGFISFKQILFLGLILYLVSASIYLLCRIIFRKASFGVMVSYLIIGYNLYFGLFHDVLKAATCDALISSYKIAIPLSITILTGIGIFLKKRVTFLTKLVFYLNTLTAILFAVEFVILIKNANNFSETGNLIYPHTPLSDHFITDAISDSSKPDIFLLVYDEYTSNEMLEHLWNYDNSEVTNWLRQRGFFVPLKSQANYNFTPFSMSSTLNMNYLDSCKWTNGNFFLSTLQAVKSISNNETLSILKKENYDFRFFTPFQNNIEDIGVLKEFSDIPRKQLYNTLFLYRIQRDILWNFTENRLSNLIWKLFNSTHENSVSKRVGDIHSTIRNVKLAVASSNTSPKLVYAHLMITHNPHLFDSSGQVTGKLDMDSLEFFNSYPYQVKYANKTITDLVECIQTNNKRKAIIIIMGDHGFRRLPPSMIEYNFPNFCAVYFPGRNYSMLYDTISPVNIFKVVFNTCFHQNFPMSKDTSIAVTYQ